MINLAIFYCINDFFFPLHCKDIAYSLILLFSLPPLLLSITAPPVTPVHCWWGESPSYVLSLLKSFLMDWKAYILFPNEAQWPNVLNCETSCLVRLWAAERWLALSCFVLFPDSSYWILGKRRRFPGKSLSFSLSLFWITETPQRPPILIDHLSTLPDVVMQRNGSCRFAF